MYRQADTKPNFSDIARRYDMDRHTVAKYWRGMPDGVEDGRSSRASGFEAVREAIAEKAALPGATKKGVHEFLLDRYPGLGLPGYSAFTKFCRENGIATGGPGGPEPHPRYETPPGQQMQFDWKEDLTMVSRHGEVFEFSVFSATLSWSRLHCFVYSRSRTSEDLCRCLLEVFDKIGGVPREGLTDNMSSIVVLSGGKRRKVRLPWAFCGEAGMELQLCAVGVPQTKGKDESANRFLNRLAVYDRDFEDEAELLAIIARIEARCNAEVNRQTGMPPAALFMREKDSLQPIGNRRLLEEMIGGVSYQVVPPTMLVRARGAEFSVPRRCIGRKVRVASSKSGLVEVRMGSEVVAVHDASAASRVNYSPEHYAEAISGKRRFAGEDIEEASMANLEMLRELGR